MTQMKTKNYLLQKTEDEAVLQEQEGMTSFYEVNVTLTHKVNKDIARKENYRRQHPSRTQT